MQIVSRHGTAEFLNALATRAYVDARIGRDSSKPRDTELNMGGRAIKNLSDPISPQDAVTKSYADTHAAGGVALLPVDGSRSMTGNLSMGDHTIVNVSDPTTPQDAATKRYVDARLRTYNFRNGTFGTVQAIPFIGKTYTPFGGQIAVLGVWVAINDTNHQIIRWKNAFSPNSNIPLTLEIQQQPALAIIIIVGPNISNATGDWILQMLEYPAGTAQT